MIATKKPDFSLSFATKLLHFGHVSGAVVNGRCVMSWTTFALKAITKRFSQREDGSMTAEAVLWLPVYLAFFAITADVALMFHGQAKATRIVQDANRHASSGYFLTKEEVEANVLARLQVFSPAAQVETTYGTTDVQTFVSLPASDLVAIGLLDSFSNLNVSASAYHRLEVR